MTLVGLVAGVGLVVLATFQPSIMSWLGVERPTVLTGSWVLDWLIIAALVHLAVRWLLQHAPNQARHVSWVSRGALLATAGILAVTAGVGVYARLSTSLSAAVLVFGTAVVVLLWLYLCFVALLWGAVVEADDQRRGADAAGDAVSATASEGDRPPGR